MLKGEVWGGKGVGNGRGDLRKDRGGERLWGFTYQGPG
jgi:hypothetical protein